MNPSTYTVTFLRHGESVGNLENRHQGHADFPLTEKGRAQVYALARRWQVENVTFDRAISSPLLRASETAEVVCNALKVPLEFEPGWMEINNGLLAGLNDKEAAGILVPQSSMSVFTHFGRIGESRWELYLRAGRMIQQLLDASPGKTLVIAHGGVLNMALVAIMGISPYASLSGARFMFLNTTFTTFTYDLTSHIWRMLHFDDRSHLKGSELYE
jgi:2,3-bisphosphoglycerate-dependent phosphoglycerate mutase